MASLLPWGMACKPPLNGLGQEALAKPGFYIHASESMPGFVIAPPVLSLVACVSQQKAGPRAGVLNRAQWHKYRQLGWQGTQESTSRWATAKAYPGCSYPRQQGAVYIMSIYLRQGKSWVSAFHPQAHEAPPWTLPSTPLSAVYQTLPLLCQWEDTGKPHTPV